MLSARTKAPHSHWALPWVVLYALVSACGPTTQHQEPSDLRERLFEADMGNDITYDHPQVAPHLRRVVQYAGRMPMNIAEYDQQGRLTFHYYRQYVGAFWPGRYLTMIWAHVYQGDRLARTYMLHSNVGFQIQDYAYGWWGRTVRQYVRDSPDESDTRQANENPYGYIAQLQNFPAVLHDPKLQALQTQGQQRLCSEQVYGWDGLLDQEVYWDENEIRQRTTVSTYNADRQLVGQVSTVAGTADQTVTLTYDAHRRLLQALVLGVARDTVHLRHYRYTAQGRVQDTFDFIEHMHSPGFSNMDEYVKSSFQYAPNGLRTQQTESTLLVDKKKGFSGQGYLTAQTVYRYNSEGYLVEALTRDYQTKATTRQHYHYTYAYWASNSSAAR